MALLSGENFESTLASNGEDALVRLSERRFDLLVTDFQMPRMNGLVLLKQVQQDHPHLPVILMSGALTAQTARAALEGGAAAVLGKPFGRVKLCGVLELLFPHHKGPC